MPIDIQDNPITSTEQSKLFKTFLLLINQKQAIISNKNVLKIKNVWKIKFSNNIDRADQTLHKHLLATKMF